MSTNTSFLKMFLCMASLVVLVGCGGDKDPNGANGQDFLAPNIPMDDGSSIPYPDGTFANGRPVTDFTAEHVLFGFDSTHIAPVELRKLDAVAEYMTSRQNGTVVAIVEGHCDERGSSEYNMALGERRALATRSYLVGAGVSPDRLTTRSLGEEDPVDPGHAEAAWRLNRRSEFELFRP